MVAVVATGMDTHLGSMSGLNCSSIDVFKKIEDLTNLTSLEVAQWGGDVIGNNSVIIDLSNTNLKLLSIHGVTVNIYMPNTVEEINMSNAGVPIIDENSICLTKLLFSSPRNNANLKNEFFDSLKNAPNLSSLYLNRLVNLNITSLSEYLSDTLINVTSLNLSGYTASNFNSILKNLNGLEYFPNLETLEMNYTSANLDISAIKNCQKLTSVTLGYCNVQSLSGLEGLTNLQTLVLNNNNITGVKELENLTNLTSLNLENNLIADTASYVNEAGETVTYNNLEILANLNSNRNGKLATLLLSGNENIINFSPVSSLTWSSKSGF